MIGWRGGCRCEVYPRVCGGTLMVARRLCRAGGLSPRVRGNLGWDSARPADQGSIPACAGEPCYLSHRIISRVVYPRVCGGT